MRYLLGLACGLLLLLTSCDYDEYTIEMKPKGAQVEREIAVGRHTDSGATQPSAELVEPIRKAYPKETTTQPGQGSRSFAGTFGPKLPNDVGNAGEYQTFPTSLGAAGMYLERFRGNDDLLASLQAMGKSADTLCDTLIGWFELQFKGDNDLPKLRQFVDKDLRHDIKNLAICLWTTGSRLSLLDEAREKPEGLEERTYGTTFARAAQYAIERNYVTLDTAPQLLRAIGGIDSGGGQESLQILRKLGSKALADKAGIHPQTAQKVLADLGDPDKSVEFVQFVETTAAFKEWKRNTEAAAKAETKPGEPATQPDFSGGNFLNDLLQGLTVFEMGGVTSDELNISLKLPVAPWQTNGTWDEKAMTIGWQVKLASRADSEQAPRMAYAVWAAPDEKLQARLFGRVILKDDKLLEYCLWRQALTPQEAKTWDAMLDSLRPGDAMRKLTPATSPAEGASDAQKYLAKGASLIFAALGRQAE